MATIKRSVAKNSEPSVYLEEFLYRGRSPGSDIPPAWHIILGSYEERKDAFGRVVPTEPLVLNMEQADEMGHDLPKTLEGINKDLMIEVERLRVRNRDLEEQLNDFDMRAIRAERLLKDQEQELKIAEQKSRIAFVRGIAENPERNQVEEE